MAFGASIVAGRWPPGSIHPISLRSGIEPVRLGPLDHLADILTWSAAVAWAHALTGRDAMRARTRVDRLLTILSALGSYLGTYLLLMAATIGAAILLTVGRGLDEFDPAYPSTFTVLALVVPGAVLMVGGLVLARRVRAWERRA